MTPERPVKNVGKQIKSPLQPGEKEKEKKITMLPHPSQRHSVQITQPLGANTHISTSVEFQGSYLASVDPLVSEKERVQHAALEIWKVTGYCFRVHCHWPLKMGHKTLLWCCQDEDKKQKLQPSQREGAKHHDTMGMKCKQGTQSIRIKHTNAHTTYYDVTMPPEATQIIRDQLEWSTPSSLVPKIQTLYPHVTPAQVHSAWTKMSKVLWKKDTNQLTSARTLLDECSNEVDIFDMETPHGVEQICWGMKKISSMLEGKTWATCLHDHYHIHPQFIHVDKDMAEISMLKSVWPSAKIQLCWWHLQRAVQEWLARAKLSTTPYHLLWANHEFSFISVDFQPLGTPDVADITTKLGISSDKSITGTGRVISNTKLTIKVKAPKQLESTPSQAFCPTDLHETVAVMIENHFCAHPFIPGYSHPSPAGICQWAVKQMYKFFWAYLWENWYCHGCWELWVQSAEPNEIPRLKTTMVMESHWHRIKVDFLHHFSKPHVDLLLSSWRKSFKHEWQCASNTPITIPLNDKYWPDTHKWVVHMVSPIFFLEVQHHRSLPFWSHPTLITLDNSLPHPAITLEQVDGGTETEGDVLRLEGEMLDEGRDEDACEHIVDTAARHSMGMDTCTFQEHFQSIIMNFRDFFDGLEYQIQFNDHRMLHTVEHEGASFIRLMENCLDRERRANSSLRQSPTTWEKGTANAMFYRSQPSLSDQAT
ncbi:hypothetical protein M404DRAFT_17256 [Pisolithus tinctorius Marx 270]|uniref:MULE transposase domain-containing protein n=1 Tax=Pisolithus tinctorius Marx 270 TaxID=870435 RepID=A0A0C3J8B0_PISTI|nr:hypothetical protein M404DRAFT_17256 [Pisolithus tinctorius Marx 270]